MLQVVRRGPLDDQHYASITDIHVEAALKITSSRDATVRVWESTASLHGIQLNSVQVAREHTNWIMQIEPVQQRFVSVGADAAGVVWRWTQGNDGIEMVRKVYFEDAIESVKCEQGKLIMAGLDEKIAVWDTENFERVEFAKAGKNAKTSFYSVDAKDSVFAAGAVDGIIRVWDSRDPQEEFLRLGKSFVGSTIRSLKISPCGQFILAGGLDGNSQLKLWDIRNIGSGKQSALWSVDVLPEKRSIWSIDCTAGFEKAVVVGNSNQVCLVDLKSQARSKLISLEESDTALRVKFDKSSLETNESIYVCASQGGVIYVPSSSGIPNTLIESGVGIKRAKTLVDNLCIVCENTKGEVSILNALTGKLESYIGTSKTWDQVLKDYKPEFIVSRWFSVDTHLGCLSLSLKKQLLNCKIYPLILQILANKRSTLVNW
jgi:WD40 repeat protein